MIHDDTSLNRNAAAVASTLDTRWLLGVAIVMPILLAAGVYWLHHLPDGPATRGSGPIIDVRLVQPPAPVPTPEQAAPRPETVATEGRRESFIVAPERPIPEETERALSAIAAANPAPSPVETPSANPARVRTVPSGAALAFQRTLLSHIARYRPSRRDKLQGVAQVMFVMTRNGAVAEVWVRTSSGHRLLDEAATDTVRRAQPLPVIPAELPDRLTILLPVAFDVP